MGINRAVFRKTLSDFTGARLTAAYLAFVSVPLLLFSKIASSTNIIPVISMDLRTEYLFGFFSVFVVLWICGVALSILAAYFGSALIAQEASDRTLLLLATKPISRKSIFISKLAAMLAALAIQISLSLALATYIWVSSFDLDLSALLMFLSKLPIFAVYALFVALFFGTLSASISAVSSSRLRAVLPSILLIIVAFFVFIQIRGATRAMGGYDGLLGFSDIGYDLGNIYISTLEKGGIRTIPLIQGIIGKFMGTYRTPQNLMEIDYDHGVILPQLEKEEFRTAGQSAAKLSAISLSLTLLGMLAFSRRDIH